MLYVLVFIASVNGGTVMHTQEFQSKERCEVVRDYVLKKESFFYKQTECFPK